MPKPTYEELIAYAAGNMPPDQADLVSASVRSDPAAAAVVNAWRAVHRLVAGDDSVQPSSAALARAKAVFEQRSSPTRVGTAIESWISAIDRFAARLIYDSRVQPATVRHGQPDDRLMLTFETDEGEVDVQAERLGASGRWRIMGQIAGSSIAQRDVAAVACGSAQIAGRTVSDDRGGFTLDVPPGEYELLLRRGEGATLLAPLPLV